MKKGVVLFSILFLVLTIGINVILAAEELSEEDQVIAAYDCLSNIIEEKGCNASTMTISEKIFALLSLKECKSELLEEAELNNEEEVECWGTAIGCNIKTTAQATLALHEAGVDTTVSQEWLLNQKMVPDELVWYLEIDSTNLETPMECTITYKGSPYEIEIGKDKIITPIGVLGNCLSFNPDWSGHYWLEIGSTDSTCHEEEYSISCNESFLTTLLYHEKESNTIHVIASTNNAHEGGTTKERIKSYCFEKSGSCDYEGSLWAAMILDYLGEDVSEFIPYLVTTYENHRNDFPGPFLYMLTDELQYKNDILDYQISNPGYWEEGTGKYYDSALALLPFTYSDSFSEKDNTIAWLLDVQPESGCWEGENIVDNGFLLYSIWPYLGPSEGGEIIDDEDNNITEYDNDCESSNYWCMSSRNCEGYILSEYDCDGLYVCCNQENIEPTCNDLTGEICASNQYCLGGETQSVVGLNNGEECCVGGSCEVKEDEPGENECEDAGGSCESYSCASGYESTEDYNCEYGDTCCISTGKTGGNYLWIWILFILIILIVVVIIYREKLKEIFMKMKSKGGKGPSTTQHRRPGYPPAPGYNRMPSRRPPIQRKIMPPQQQRKPIKRPEKNPRELDDVLKKLKEMGK